MKIAVDVCIGRDGAKLLRYFGHEVIEAEHAESDRDWFARAITAGAEYFISADADIEILAYDANVRFFRAKQGVSGLVTAQRFLSRDKRREKLDRRTKAD